MSLENLAPCEAPWYAPEGHSQTILGYLLSSPSLPDAGEKWVFSLSDGDQLVTRVHGPTTDPGTVLTLVHGLGGDIGSKYMHIAGLVGLSRGWTVLRVNMRGCGEGFGMAKGIYHSGRSEDISQILGHVRERWPRARRLAAGFSLSGNVLLNLLAGFDGAERPDAAVVFNPAIHLAHASKRLDAGIGLVYDRSFVRDLLALLHRAKATHHLANLPKKLTVSAFDNFVVAPEAGYRDRHEYYEKCSSWNRLYQIQTPTVVVMAADDPIIPIDDFQTAKWSSSTIVRYEKVGGHMGYLTNQKVYQGTSRWLGAALEASFDELGFKN